MGPTDRMKIPACIRRFRPRVLGEARPETNIALSLIGLKGLPGEALADALIQGIGTSPEMHLWRTAPVAVLLAY
eukprot:scaffold139705_cov39-Prasinocladus_malaysianus.AAC.1